MIYFFTKGPQFLRCEIFPGTPNELRVIGPDGIEQRESYSSEGELVDRWGQVCGELSQAGWSGPWGRDART